MSQIFGSGITDGPIGFRPVLVLAVRGSAQDNLETDPTTSEVTTGPRAEQIAGPMTGPEATGMAYPSTRTAVLLLDLHALLSVSWAVFAGKPSKDWLDLIFPLIMVFNYVCINPLDHDRHRCRPWTSG